MSIDTGKVSSLEILLQSLLYFINYVTFHLSVVLVLYMEKISILITIKVVPTRYPKEYNAIGFKGNLRPHHASDLDSSVRITTFVGFCRWTRCTKFLEREIVTFLHDFEFIDKIPPISHPFIGYGLGAVF